MLKTAGQVCRELGIKYYQLDYIIRNGHAPEPGHLGSGQRVFSDKDIKAVKKALLKRKEPHEDTKEDTDRRA